MDKELIELLKHVTGSTETLVVWYLAVDFAKDVVAGITVVSGFYMFGRGVRAVKEYVDESL